MPSTTSEQRESRVRTPDGQDWGRREGDKLLECEKCGALRRTQAQMQTHKYESHGEDRRKPVETQTPPAPERKPKESKPEPTEEKPKRKGSRWFARPE